MVASGARRVQSTVQGGDWRQVAGRASSLGRVRLLEGASGGFPRWETGPLSPGFDRELLPTKTSANGWHKGVSGGGVRIAAVRTCGSSGVGALMFKSTAVAASRLFKIATRFL